MNLKAWTKISLSFIAILLLAAVMSVTFSDRTQLQENNKEFQSTHAKLVNFIMYLNQTLSDFDEYDFDEELLENLQTELELALTVTRRSSVAATVEYSLGFLRMAYSSLLEDAIESEIDATQLLIEELDKLTEESFTSASWSDLQEQLDSVADAVDDILQKLDQLGIKFGIGSAETEEQVESLEVLVIELPDLTSELSEIFNTLVEIREALVSSHHDILETSTEASYTSDEMQVREPVVHINNEISDIKNNTNDELEEQAVNYCPRNNDECLALLLPVARFDLRNLLINHDVRNVDPLAFENANQVLTGGDLEEILNTLDLLLGS